jgi:hypothetical protein
MKPYKQALIALGVTAGFALAGYGLAKGLSSNYRPRAPAAVHAPLPAGDPYAEEVARRIFEDSLYSSGLSPMPPADSAAPILGKW